ncbi:MAG: hypothetical protein WBD20_06875 [Pirellulaceae bacterium]
MNTKAYGFATSALGVFLGGVLLIASPFQNVTAQEPVKQEPATREVVKTKTLAQQIVGTWELEAAKSPGSPSGIGSRLKMFTGTHWCVIQPDVNTGVIVFQHGGRYSLDGDTLKTTREFAGQSTKSLIGSAGRFKIEIDGDTLKQADSEGVFNESWKRLK